MLRLVPLNVNKKVRRGEGDEFEKDKKRDRNGKKECPKALRDDSLEVLKEREDREGSKKREELGGSPVPWPQKDTLIKQRDGAE